MSQPTAAAAAASSSSMVAESISIGSVEITSWRCNAKQRAMYATSNIRKGELVFCERSIAFCSSKDADAIGDAAAAAVEPSLIGCTPKVKASMVAYAAKYAAAVSMSKSLSAGGSQHSMHVFMAAMVSRKMDNSGRPREGESENVHKLHGVRELVEREVLTMLGVPISIMFDDKVALAAVRSDVSKILTNQFLAENQGRGSAFCPLTAMINHGCVANCDYACSIHGAFGPSCAIVQVFASRDIQRGEEITISYATDLGNNRSARWLILKATHGFPVCMCSACRLDLCITDALPVKRVVVVTCFWCGTHLQGSPLEQSEFCGQSCQESCKNKYPSALSAVPPNERQDAMVPFIREVRSWISPPGPVANAFATAVTEATTPKIGAALASMLGADVSGPLPQSCGAPTCTALGTKRCSGCKCIAYCSAECQQGHWAVHKLKCFRAPTVLEAAAKTLNAIIDETQQITEQRKNASSEARKKILDARKQALKRMANSMYGMGHHGL